MKRSMTVIGFPIMLLGLFALLKPSLGLANEDSKQILHDLLKIKSYVPAGRPTYLRLAISENSTGSKLKSDTVSIWNDGVLYRMKTNKLEMLHNAKSQVRVDHHTKVIYIGASLPQDYLKTLNQMNFRLLDSMLNEKLLIASVVLNTNSEKRIRFVSKNKFATYELTYNKKTYKPISYTIHLAVEKQKFQSNISFFEYRLLKREEQRVFSVSSFFNEIGGRIKLKDKFKAYKIVKI